MGGFPTLEVFDLYECGKLTDFLKCRKVSCPS
jgi:hypothetical protein